MLAPVRHILPVTTIRRERLLPIQGKISVRKGQKVSVTDTVAEASLSPAHLLLDLSRGLGLPPEKTDQHIQCKAGDSVDAGDILAGPVGLARRVVRAPKKARVVVAGGGQVLLEVQNKPFELKAALPGMVMDLIPERGVVIETTGALIQGVWGNGGIGFGLMLVLAKTPNHVLTRDQLEVSYRGSVILAGHCAEEDVIKMAGELPLRGLILASMAPSVIPVAEKSPVPVMILEGFGQRPMNTAAFNLLTTNEQREVAINAEPWDPYTGTRPEVIIPLPAPGDTQQSKDVQVLEPGKQVYILRAPHAGKVGRLLSAGGMKTFPSGVRALSALVRFDDGTEALVPAANLEIIQ